MAPLADFILKNVPLPSPPRHLTSYVSGTTPMSTPQEVFPALAAYLAVIFGIQALMKNRKPMKLQYLFQLHNIILSSGSFLLLALIVEQVAPRFWKGGLFYSMCHDEMWIKVCIRFTSFLVVDVSDDNRLSRGV